MSKYYKVEDVINKYAEMIASDAYWEYGVGNEKPDEEDLDIARDYYSDLPTIEASEDCSDYYKGYCARYEDGCLHQCKDAPSEDCISRERLLKYITNGVGALADTTETFVDVIKNAPSVVPKRAEGEWIVRANGSEDERIEE